jgi:hypothetical protein
VPSTSQVRYIDIRGAQDISFDAIQRLLREALVHGAL